jgi:beta-glucosidase
MDYRDRLLRPEQRADALLRLMTTDEKIDQMLLNADLTEVCTKLKNDDMSGIYGNAFTIDDIPVDTIRFIQSYLVKKTRLGIPMLIAGESLHGVLNPNTTVFPQSIGLASMFNTDLMGKIADVLGSEADALGIRQVYAPDLDLAREPRWGRAAECYGEDPYLVGEYGKAYVKGVQAHSVAATLKHFVAHGTPLSGLNLAPVAVGIRELKEVMLEPFKECIAAGAMSVMPAYSEIDGIPLHASVFLLRDLLRKELGFDGTVVSDYTAVEKLHSFHRTAKTPLDAGTQAINAGVDIEAPAPFGYGGAFREAVKRGDIPIELIDGAARRVLTLKFKLGLFENPYPKENAFELIHTPKALEIAEQAARESAVLLKNDGVLPLKSPCKIALIGPNADLAQLGNYTYYPDCADKSVTLRRALSERIGGNLLYARGCRIASADDAEKREAVDAVKKSDVAVVVLGDASMIYGGRGWGNEDDNQIVTDGESFDVHDITLPAPQRELLKAVKAVGKPVVLLLMSGRPRAIAEECWAADAVMQIWYPGERGGYAVCDLLFASAVPSGKLPVTIPKSTGHLPCYYNHKPSAKGVYKKPGSPDSPGNDYVFDSPDPLFPFGYGLSYTAFEYSDIKISHPAQGAINVSVTIKNTGDYDAYETALLFLSANYCPVTPFVKRLRAFKKIFLRKGEKQVIAFVLRDRDFTYLDANLDTKINFGEYTVAVGGLTADFEYAAD